MKKKKQPKKMMIEVSKYEELKANQISRVSFERMSEAFTDKIFSPFDEIIEGLEEKLERIQELKEEMEDLAN